LDDAAIHILYVDDDAGLRRLTERALRRRGFAVTTAAGGAEGVEKARAGTFDLIAIDHYMPGMDGLETLAAIRALDDPPPVVYVTGSDETAVAVSALKAGAADYVVKTVGEDFFDLLAQSFENTLATVRLEAAKREVERELRESNERLATMLREVDHRVANSLQLVTAFVQMQAHATADESAKRALADTQHRIEAVAAVHRHLYTAATAERVALDAYLSSLVTGMEASLGDARRCTGVALAAEPCEVAADRAVSVGIIVAELVSNAAKYAYAEGEPGEVRVALKLAEGEAEIRVEDDGCGLPGDGASKGTGMGMRVIEAMAKSLRGTLTVETPPRGACFSLRFAA
jgi:two-component sensor histidine kinase